MSKLINKIFLKHYRGFKDEQEIVLADCGQVTFLVGANNSGKSLIARLFSMFSFQVNESIANNYMIINHINDYDFYKLETEKPIIIKFQIEKSGIDINNDSDFVKIKDKDEIFLCFKIIKNIDNCFWCIYLSDGNNDSHNFEIVNNLVKNEYNSGFSQYSKADIEKICRKLYYELQKSVLVFDPIRAFDRDTENSFFVSGTELLKWLDENKNPGEVRKVKQEVARLLKSEFNLESPHDISVDEDKKRLRFVFDDGIKLSSNEVGTGYTMLYILLMEIERNLSKIVVIDEVESHLQPGITRILMKIIKDKENMQYIVSTHSPAVMETSRENDYLYRFYKDEYACTIEGFFRNHSKNESTSDARILREVCNELGVIPGDALLSNCVIWVEGPSEIFWLRAWIKAFFTKYKKEKNLKNNIIEGLHYSIMMTGGGNIANYSFSEDETYIEKIKENEKLRLLRVNPNAFVIVDSDNAKRDGEKWKRIVRIAKELNEQNKLSSKLLGQTIKDDTDVEDSLDKIPNIWVQQGKELENYSHPQILKDFYEQKSNHGNSTIQGVDSCSNWSVYSITEGVGELLEKRGILNVKAKSGTIKHKIDLAHFMFNNFDSIHFEKKPENMLQPNTDMIDNLISNLTKLLDYIVKINNLN